MTSVPKTVQNDREGRLNSWKEIAAFLERDERTVKRWEKSRALPVHRLPGGPGRVFAFRSEIDSWQCTSPVPVAAPPLNAVASPGRRRTPLRLAGFVASALCISTVVSLGVVRTFKARRVVPAEAHVHVPPQQARNLYLSGRFYWNKRTSADLQTALQDFQAALALDPDYAAAYAGVADCYGLATEFASMPPAQAYPKMFEAAQRAIALDPNLAEGHRALGFALFYWNWDRAGSRREFERALALEAHDATTYHWFANVLMTSQDYKGALQMIDKARELDPASPSILADRGLILRQAGQEKEAAEIWEGLERSDPTYLPPHWYHSRMARDQSDFSTYLTELRTIAGLTHSPGDFQRLAACEEGYRRAGREGLLEADARSKVEAIRHDSVDYLGTANALELAHRKEDALAYIELAYQHRASDYPALAGADVFPDLADNPRFKELKALSLLPFRGAASLSKN